MVSCGEVALSWQSNLLGFPNAYLGLICEPVVITLALAGIGRTQFPKRFMKTALAINLSVSTHEKVSNLLQKGWDYVVVTAVYSILIVAILFKYGKYFLPDF